MLSSPFTRPGPRFTVIRALAVEEVVKASSLEDGEDCWLSNGVRGFTFGRIKLD